MSHEFNSSRRPESGEVTFYLDRSQRIDALVLRFKDQITHGQFPSLRKQKPFIDGLRYQKSIPAAEKLLDFNHGVIATIAFPYKSVTQDHEALLKKSAISMIGAVRSYKHTLDIDYIFYDHIVSYIDDDLKGDYREPHVNIFGGAGTEDYSHWNALRQYATLLQRKPDTSDEPIVLTELSPN